MQPVDGRFFSIFDHTARVEDHPHHFPATRTWRPPSGEVMPVIFCKATRNSGLFSYGSKAAGQKSHLPYRRVSGVCFVRAVPTKHPGPANVKPSSFRRLITPLLARMSPLLCLAGSIRYAHREPGPQRHEKCPSPYVTRLAASVALPLVPPAWSNDFDSKW